MLSALFTFLGLHVLDPEALFSIDAGIKLLQAQSLRESGLASVAIPYPAHSLDPLHEYLPFMLPFVFERGGTLHGMYPLAVAGTYAAVLSTGLIGTVLISLVSALLVMLAMIRVAGRHAFPAIVVLAVCTPFWAYGVLMWEHMPALACSTWAWAALDRPGRPLILAAGALLGIAIALRPESVLIVPGLALMYRSRLTISGLARLGLAIALPLAAVGVVDAFVYERTPFIHVIHAVDVAWRAVGSSAPVARPQPTPFSEQARIVIGDWVVGVPGAGLGSTLLAVVLAAHWCGRHGRTLLIAGVLAAAMALAIRDLAVTWASPELLAGLLRGSPCLLLALLPALSPETVTNARRMEMLAVAVFVFGLFVTRQYGGVQIGPRFLVPLLPLLAKMAAESFGSYLLAPRRHGAPMIAMLSAAVLALSAAIQVVANFRTVEIVNEEGTQLLKFVRESHASGVVISDLFLINHVAPVYGDTLVMRATEAREAAAVSQRLAARGLTPIVTIDRIAPGTYRATLPHYHPVGVIDTPHARATKWTRQTALASTPQLLATDGVIP